MPTNFSKHITRQISDDVIAIWSELIYDNMWNEYYSCKMCVKHSVPEFARSHMQAIIWDIIGKVQEYKF
jgi:hypothetical protein